LRVQRFDEPAAREAEQQVRAMGAARRILIGAGAAAAVLGGCLGAAPAASAGDEYSPGYSGLLIDAEYGDNVRSRIRLSGNEDVFILESSRGWEQYGTSECHRPDSHTLRCPPPDGGVLLALGSGADVGDSSDSPLGINTIGEAGADTLIGSEFGEQIGGAEGTDRIDGLGGSDKLNGGEDADRLDGGKGRDQLKGRQGADTIAGGGGADVIFANDGDRDRAIHCGGGGRDFARIDAIDPQPRGCEVVDRIADEGDTGAAR